MLGNHPEKDLIQRSKAGDLAAFGELVRVHQGWLRGWLRAQLRDWTAADDLAQDTFVTAFKKIAEFRGDGALEAWLRSIAHNHFRNYIRKKREDYVGGDFELQSLLALDEGQHHVSDHASLEALRECLTRIQGVSHELLMERYVHGRSVRELAEDFQQGYSALTMKLHRLRKVLADCIKTKLAADNV